MEKKTIGSFLAVLRKASGMTQKQLAEKLNVSDKTVSRWERDECAPDLTLIPVLAEIFGVTSDEILRGERISEEKMAEETHKKNEKQLEYILNNLKSKFLIKCLISDAVAVVGLIVAYILSIALFAMDTNSYEAKKVAFFVGCICNIFALIMAVGFSISTFSSLKNDEINSNKLNETKKYIVKYSKWSCLIILFIFIVSLDFVIDSSMCFYAFGLWFDFSIYNAIISILIVFGLSMCFLIGTIVDKITIKKGFYSVNEKENKDLSVRIICTLITICLLFITVNIQQCIHYDDTALVESLVEGTTYTEFEELKIFLETPMDEDGIIVEPDKNRNYEFLEGYYDGDNVTETQDTFNEEDFEKVKVKINENTVKEVILRNQSILRWSCNLDDDSIDFQLPVTIWTNQDYEQCQTTIDRLNNRFIFIYFSEMILGLIIYFVVRNKIFAQKSAK